MFRLLLSLFLILAISAPSCADTLVKRYASSEVYQVDANTKKLVVGGDIENALPFDGGNEYVPWNLVFAEGTPVGNWTWLGKGTQGYLVKPSTSTVRVYPVRGDQTKYIEIAPIAAQPSIVNQVSAKSLELYVDQPNTRWSLSMTPQGFKPNILLKPGYAGDGTFQFRFELNGGLTLLGKKIMDGVTEVLVMHNPFLVDAEGINRAVDEELVDGIVTLTADLSGLDYPILVDPTLGPINPTKDTHIISSNPTAGNGQLTNLRLNNRSTSIVRTLCSFDASAVPASAAVTSSTFELYHELNPFGSPNGLTVDLLRMTISDWEDAGATTIGAEANWNDYKDPSVAWPGGAGALGDTDATDSVSTTVPGVGNWMQFTPNAMVQDAIDNQSGIFNVMVKFNSEASGSNNVPQFSSLESITASQRPKLTIIYTDPSAA
jgi:hypothetical protein